MTKLPIYTASIPFTCLCLTGWQVEISKTSWSFMALKKFLPISQPPEKQKPRSPNKPGNVIPFNHDKENTWQSRLTGDLSTVLMCFLMSFFDSLNLISNNSSPRCRPWPAKWQHHLAKRTACFFGAKLKDKVCCTVVATSSSSQKTSSPQMAILHKNHGYLQNGMVKTCKD